MREIMRRAHQIRKTAAIKFGGRPGDFSLSIALKMAWEEKEMNKKQAEIGRDYSGMFRVKKGSKLIYLGGISFRAISPEGREKTADSQATYDKIIENLNTTKATMGEIR